MEEITFSSKIYLGAKYTFKGIIIEAIISPRELFSNKEISFCAGCYFAGKNNCRDIDCIADNGEHILNYIWRKIDEEDTK